MKINLKKYGLTAFALLVIFVASAITTSGGVFASSPQQLYDQVWKLINSKYVDHTNNQQDWKRWKNSNRVKCISKELYSIWFSEIS